MNSSRLIINVRMGIALLQAPFIIQLSLFLFMLFLCVGLAAREQTLWIGSALRRPQSFSARGRATGSAFGCAYCLIINLASVTLSPCMKPELNYVVINRISVFDRQCHWRLQGYTTNWIITLYTSHVHYNVFSNHYQVVLWNVTSNNSDFVSICQACFIKSHEKSPEILEKKFREIASKQKQFSKIVFYDFLRLHTKVSWV